MRIRAFRQRDAVISTSECRCSSTQGSSDRSRYTAMLVASDLDFAAGTFLKSICLHRDHISPPSWRLATRYAKSALLSAWVGSRLIVRSIQLGSSATQAFRAAKLRSYRKPAYSY